MNQRDLWEKEYSSNNEWKKETKRIPINLKDKIVLELGVGNGKTLKTIIRQSPKKAFAIDFSNEALKKAKENIKSKIVVFKKANVTKMSFKNETFDIIICYYILNNLIEKERKLAIKEINRVLKKNGKIIFEDFLVGDFRQNKLVKSIEKNTIIKKNGIICHFFNRKELTSLFKEFNSNFKETISKPIKNTQLKRKIISGIIKKN